MSKTLEWVLIIRHSLKLVFFLIFYFVEIEMIFMMHVFGPKVGFRGQATLDATLLCL